MTISEIAKLAGVSSAAVSRYLNNGSLSGEKRERIEQIVRKYNYQPSQNARAMRTKKSQRIGVVVPQIDSESVPRILSGISQVLDQKQYQVMLMNSNRDLEKEVQILESFENSQVDGLLLAASVLTERHEKALERLPFPIVIIGQQSREYSCVYHNDFEAAYEMMRHLLAEGSNYPVYLGVNRKDEAAGENRYQGVKRALEAYGKKIEQIPSAEVDFTVESGYEGMKHLLERQERIDSVFCATDLIAVGALTCLKDQGYRVPQDVKVTGMGHGMMADLITPKLTTVHYSYKTSGMEAARLLVEQIENPEIEKRERLLEYRMVFQGTG